MELPAAQPTLRSLRTFMDGAHVAAPGEVPELATRAAQAAGWSARLYMADFEQRLLVPLPAPSLPPGEVLPIEGTLAGRAFMRSEPLAVPGAAVLWVPLLDGIHRLGVIEFTMPDGTDLAAEETEDRYTLLAHVYGHMIAGKLPYGDALAIHARRRSRTVASELLASLLPPLTFGCPGLVVSGILEPCYDVAADAFDYSVIDKTAYLAIFDATGHDLRGTTVAAVALAACRKGRRDGRGLVDTANLIDDAILELWGGQLFATGLLAELEIATGRLRYLVAGHPPPFVMRWGRAVKELVGGRRILFGLGDGAVVVAEEWLESGDWVVMYTDGVVEARDAQGTFYGRERLEDQFRRTAAAGFPAPETLRRVMHEVLDHQGGVLQDDASILVAQWASGEEDQLAASPGRSYEARRLRTGTDRARSPLDTTTSVNGASA